MQIPFADFMRVRIEVTTTPLQLTHDPGLDYLLAVEFGAVVDGKAQEEYIGIDDDRAWIRRDPEGPVIGFIVNAHAEYDPAAHPELFEGYRFDVPVLGLEQATAGEIILSGSATLGPAPTADVVFFDQAVHSQGTDQAEAAWRCCLTTGNMKAHFGLGYTLWELGRLQEAYRHLRSYTELAAHNSWAWCWLGKACVSLDLDIEARAAFERAIELEGAGSFETDAGELMRGLNLSSRSV